MRRPAPYACLGGLALALMGCAHAKIPGTELADTADNRALFATMQRLRDGFESKDPARILPEVSTHYFEDNGTPDPRDDYGYVELKDVLLRTSLDLAKEAYLVFELHDIVVKDDYAYVDVRYATRTRLDFPGGRLWDNHRDFNRIEFAREPEGWKVISGL